MAGSDRRDVARRASRGGRSARARWLAAAVAVALAGPLAGLPEGPAARASAGAPPTAAARDEVRDGVRGVERHLDRIRHDPVRLRRFLLAMPKGGDIHTHLSGAVTTEVLIRMAADAGLCIDPTYTAVRPPCGPGRRPATDALHDPAFFRAILRAWSMQDFVPDESGHDHFFATFGRFGAVTAEHKGRQLADVAARAAAQHEFYLEVLLSRQGARVNELADRIGFDPDLARLRRRLLADPQWPRILRAAVADTDRDMVEFARTLGCRPGHEPPGCRTVVRFDFSVGRTQPPQDVFAQLLLGEELAEVDRRYVGVNLVAPEDEVVARRDYLLHMRMVAFLRTRYRAAHVTLHAGELTAALVPPADLRFHIRAAVEVARAERIGHGVDVRSEDRYRALLRTMARRHVLVEILLTSNCQILLVCGADHPFPLYLRSGVPVTLGTDDEGVERTDLTGEYQRAVTDYHLHYAQLRTFARAALDHAFLQGPGIWRGPDDYRLGPACAGQVLGSVHPRPSCARLLHASPKAAVEWRQEAAFARFERAYSRPPA